MFTHQGAGGKQAIIPRGELFCIPGAAVPQNFCGTQQSVHEEQIIKSNVWLSERH
jgi:hypothetical protein